MLRNFLETKSSGVPEGGTDPAPRPGDYELGSLESRVAARALLSEKLAGEEENRLRVVVKRIGKAAVNLQTSTCSRYQCADSRDPSRNLLIEMVDLDGDHPTEAQSEQLDHWIGMVPMDGRTYKFAEAGNG